MWSGTALVYESRSLSRSTLDQHYEATIDGIQASTDSSFFPFPKLSLEKSMGISLKMLSRLNVFLAVFSGLGCLLLSLLPSAEALRLAPSLSSPCVTARTRRTSSFSSEGNVLSSMALVNTVTGSSSPPFSLL